MHRMRLVNTNRFIDNLFAPYGSVMLLSPISLYIHCILKYWSAFDMSTRITSPNFAVFTFSGPAFQQGIVPQSCSFSTLSYLAKHLYILDPVYGVLRSMDRMQPYRLEMGCKGVTNDKNTTKTETLASFWKDTITTHIGRQLAAISESADGGPILANLASDEYSSSVDVPSLPRNTIFLNIVFRHQGRVIAVHAKRARGLMARYIAERAATTLADVSEFDLEGYKCVGGDDKWEIEDAVGDNVRVVNMVFDRDDDVHSAPSGGVTKRKGKDSTKSNKRTKK